jgi:hypothetical protein
MFGRNFGNLREMAGNKLNQMSDGKISGDVFTKDRGMATQAADMGARAQQMMGPGQGSAPVAPADATARGGRRRRRSRKTKRSMKSKKSKKSRKTRSGRRRH